MVLSELYDNKLRKPKIMNPFSENLLLEDINNILF